MAFKVRSLRDDDVGSGVYLVLVPFIIVVLLTVVFMPMGSSSDVGFNILVTPDDYHNMSSSQRAQYLYDLHGANEKVWIFRFALSWPDFAGNWYRVFDDGFKMTNDKYNDWLDGSYTIDMNDIASMVTSILTLDPPALHQLGIYGTILRLVMIFSVVIGIVELLWIG